MLWSQLLVLCVHVLVCVCKSGPPADKNRENFSGSCFFFLFVLAR